MPGIDVICLMTKVSPWLKGNLIKAIHAQPCIRVQRKENKLFTIKLLNLVLQVTNQRDGKPDPTKSYQNLEGE